MKGLILNDLFSTKKTLRTLVFIILVFDVIWGSMGQPEAASVITSVMCISYFLNLFSYDEFYRWDKYAVILPVSRRQIVLARYAVTGLFSLVSLLISAIYLLVMRVPLGDIAGILGAALLVHLYAAGIEIPMCYKFGTQKSRLLLMLMMFIPFGLFVGIAMLFQQAGLSLPTDIIPFVVIGAAVILVLGLWFSIHLSVRIVSRKEY